MSLDWKQPFYLAAELFLWLFGWALVAIVALIGVAFTLELLRAFRNTILKKNKNKESDETSATGLKSVD
jgi:putative exporter of polyketide antibiotics